jgi:hypothetical protein
MGLIAWICRRHRRLPGHQITRSREGLLMMVVLGIVGGLVGGSRDKHPRSAGRRINLGARHRHARATPSSSSPAS